MYKLCVKYTTSPKYSLRLFAYTTHWNPSGQRYLPRPLAGSEPETLHHPPDILRAQVPIDVASRPRETQPRKREPVELQTALVLKTGRRCPRHSRLAHPIGHRRSVGIRPRRRGMRSEEELLVEQGRGTEQRLHRRPRNGTHVNVLIIKTQFLNFLYALRLGLSHDGDKKHKNNCGPLSQEGSVMAPVVSATFNKFVWSDCSKREYKKLYQ